MIVCDRITAQIIAEIYKAALKKEKITTWGIAQRVNWGDKPENINSINKQRYYIIKNKCVIERIKVMVKDGLVAVEEVYVEKNGKIRKRKDFVIMGDRVLVGRHKFPNGMHDAILLKRIDSQWIILEV